MKTITLLLILLVNSISFAQVGIGTTTPDNSAVLDVESTDKGLLPPRMTEADRDVITMPAAGLIVWCTNCGSDGEVQVFNGTIWTNMIGGAAATPPPPQVGDYRDGGVVFYIAPSPTDLNGDGNDDIGLVCAVEDQSSGIQWRNGINTTTGATATAVGTGAANTTTIIARQGQGNYAASICNNYSVTIGNTTYTDWFLPSGDELNLMYQNKATIDVTANDNGGSGFFSNNDFYWSSTEGSADNIALGQNFTAGNSSNSISKSGTLRVRAIRAF